MPMSKAGREHTGRELPSPNSTPPGLIHFVTIEPPRRGVCLQSSQLCAMVDRMSDYPGTKGGAGVWQWILNQIPATTIYAEPFMGRFTIGNKFQRPPLWRIGIESDQTTLAETLEQMGARSNGPPGGLVTNPSPWELHAIHGGFRMSPQFFHGCGIAWLERLVETGGWQSILGYVLDGLGVAIVPQSSLLSSAVNPKKLNTYPLPKKTFPGDSVSLITRKSRGQHEPEISQVATEFLSVVRETCRTD